MKTPAGFARYAGHDPMEKEIGWAGPPCSETAKAIIRSRITLNRVERWAAASRATPPRAATGGFPYNLRSVAECDPHRLKCDHTRCKPGDYGCEDDA